MNKIDLYLVNQMIDISLWSWILLIMIKRVICNRGWVVRSFHYYSDLLLLLASLLAITQFSDQFYSIITHIRPVPTLLTREIVWMIFHKSLTGAILIKYKNSQPRLFYNIKQEVKYVYNKIIYSINWSVYTFGRRTKRNSSKDTTGIS